MADDTSQAFAPPIVRAIATADSGDTPDRISVRDFVKDVEIGAFQSERGVTQRIRFNVVLEVSHSTASRDDDVDKVISYDTIVEAIDAQLETDRVNLLETVAERVAERCLDDPRAIRVFVRIEKLDRIPGTLGVEIMRRRVDGTDPAIRELETARPIAELEASPVIVHLPNAVINGPHLAAWLDQIEALDHPAIVTLEMMPMAIPPAHDMVERRMSLLAIEQNAWLLAGRDPRCVVVATRTELDHAAKIGQMSVWAPSKIALDAVHRPDADGRDPVALSVWLGEEISACGLIVIGDGADDVPGVITVSADRPADLADIHID